MRRVVGGPGPAGLAHHEAAAAQAAPGRTRRGVTTVSRSREPGLGGPVRRVAVPPAGAQLPVEVLQWSRHTSQRTARPTPDGRTRYHHAGREPPLRHDTASARHLGPAVRLPAATRDPAAPSPSCGPPAARRRRHGSGQPRTPRPGAHAEADGTATRSTPDPGPALAGVPTGAPLSPQRAPLRAHRHLRDPRVRRLKLRERRSEPLPCRIAPDRNDPVLRNIAAASGDTS